MMPGATSETKARRGNITPISIVMRVVYAYGVRSVGGVGELFFF